MGNSHLPDLPTMRPPGLLICGLPSDKAHPISELGANAVHLPNSSHSQRLSPPPQVLICGLPSDKAHPLASY